MYLSEGARITVGEDTAFQVLLKALAHKGLRAVVALPVKLARAAALRYKLERI